MSIYFYSSLLTSHYQSSCVFLYSMYASSQYINIIGINQKLISTFNFKPSWFT